MYDFMGCKSSYPYLMELSNQDWDGIYFDQPIPDDKGVDFVGFQALISIQSEALCKGSFDIASRDICVDNRGKHFVEGLEVVFDNSMWRPDQIQSNGIMEALVKAHGRKTAILIDEQLPYPPMTNGSKYRCLRGVYFSSGASEILFWGGMGDRVHWTNRHVEILEKMDKCSVFNIAGF